MTRRRGRIGVLAGLGAAGLMLMCLTLVAGLFPALEGPSTGGSGCSPGLADQPLLAPGQSAVVGATEYGGPGDPSSGTVGASGTDLITHPDSYAELGGTDFDTATDLGGLAYGTPLRIFSPTHPGRSVIAEKEDIGLGGGPIDGYPRVIDLWWLLASTLSIPYEHGAWSGPVRIQRAPATGAGNVLAGTPVPAPVSTGVTGAAGPDGSSTDATGVTGSVAASVEGADLGGCQGSQSVGTVPGARAELLPDGQAVAPADAPAAVKGIIAAGNEIVGKPYLYGGGHGLPLSEIAPSYDCSSSVAHLLWGGGLLSADADADSTTFESWGLPGPGTWVTIYASDAHVFMYVAGLRWDTHNAAGPGDGTSGIGWHPLVREADGFVARHPAGL